MLQKLPSSHNNTDIYSQVIGVAEVAYGTCPVPFDSHNSQRRAPFVCNLAVLPNYRGLGIGKALLERVEEAAIAGEGLPLQPTAPVTEIWLETGYNNIPALRMYRDAGYICEGVDPEIRQRRQSYMRKRINETSPEYVRDILSIKKVECENSGGGSRPTWTISYDLGDEECQYSYVGKLSYIEKNFGALAPFVAAVGTIVGIILF